MRIPLLAACLTIIALAPADAQLLDQRLRVFPDVPQENADFLVLINDTWSDGCGGDVSVDIASDRIAVTSTLASPRLGAACTQVLVPFRQLINPRGDAPNIAFADEVIVEYSYDAGMGPELRASTVIRFGNDGQDPAQIQTGGWVSDDLESSGLFIDQQGDIMTALVADYDDNGQATWYYGAAHVAGQVFSATIQRFSEIVCITTPCPRVAAQEGGRIDMILLDRDELVVSFDGLTLSGRIDQDPAYTYRRLRFARDGSLESLSEPIPDLVGRWVAGVHGTAGQPDDYRRVEIAFDRVDAEDSGLPRYIYRATALAGDFEISCSDRRPVDGTRECELIGFEHDEETCVAAFAYAAVGVDRVTSTADCGTSPTRQSRFEMFRTD